MEAWREELYHYGMPKRSGRYPYGSGDRPFQGEGALGARKRKSIVQVVKDYKTKKKRQKAAAKARDAKKNKAEEAEKKEKNMRNPAWVKRHMNELSNEELRTASERFRLENELRSNSIKKMNAGKEYVDFILGYGKSALDVYNTASSIYDVVDTVKNAESNKTKEKKFKEEAKAMSDEDLKNFSIRSKYEQTYVDRKMGRKNKDKK